MAGGAFDGDDEITGINVTPLVDVMLVLLVIFMVTATYIVNQNIDVELPSAETAEPGDHQSRSLSFVLDKDSSLYLDGKPVSFEQAGNVIEERKREQDPSSLQAIISADRVTPHGAVVKLIDTVRKHGITDFAINVEAGESPVD